MHDGGDATTSRRTFEDAERRLFARYELEVRSRFLDLRDPPLRVRVIEAGEGPPVLLVHGGGCVAALWAPLMAELRGVHLIGVDRPGCGLTDAFDYRGVGLRQHGVSFLDSLFDALGLDRGAILVGCPAGILGTSAPLPMRLLTLPWLGRAMLAMEPPGRRQVRRLFRRVGHRSSDGWPEEIWDAYEAYERLPGSATAYRTVLQRFMRLRGVRPEEAFGEEHLGRVRQPALFIWGDADVFGSPDVGRRAAALMPDASCNEISGGHLPWLDDPRRCADLIGAFLRDAGLESRTLD
ncbi:MAG: alpha/beta hydrolase [Actinobacteria bacterium]|nr:alpha/beta hydrolase [Actinomycetota bacterium]